MKKRRIALFCLTIFNPIYANATSLSTDYFELSIEELMNVEVSVASNISSTASEQPASTSTISKTQIQLSGARTLNELLSIYVPGYFLVEDQDDTIAGFRGLVPDNNSKTMVLLNGSNINTEWFWGAPDALLNGLDLTFIERIEVIRGPGSVTLGQGALLGVINIITDSGGKNRSAIAVTSGAGNYQTTYASLNTQVEETKISAHISKGSFSGQRMKNKGWAELRYEQGLSVFERNHHLKRSTYLNYLVNIKHNQFDFDMFHFEQKRDLYNFFRDREVVNQKIDGYSIKHVSVINHDWQLTSQVSVTEDQYQLFSHGNNTQTDQRLEYEMNDTVFSPFVLSQTSLADNQVEPGLIMGGTKERQTSGKIILNWQQPERNMETALGIEVNHYQFGLTDDYGNNFIINEEIQKLGLSSDGSGQFNALGTLNDNNTWVNPDDITLIGAFTETKISVNEQLNVFAAARFDQHPNWGNNVSPRLGMFYSLSNDQQLRLSWQSGFRGAVGMHYSGGFVQDGFLSEQSFSAVNEISTQYADFDWDGDASNDDKVISSVKPETLENVEIAYRMTQTHWTLQAIVFLNKVRDIISAEAHGYQTLNAGETIGFDTIGTWGGHWYYQNQAGSLTQKGLELEFDYKQDNFSFSASHAYVGILQVDDTAIGTYVLPNKKNAAYPENITRMQAGYSYQNDFGQWQIHYNHVYYWQYSAPTLNEIDGSHIGNIGISWTKQTDSSLSVNLIIKNVFDADGLYPINVTGDLTNADGTPSIESRAWWMELKYSF